MNKVITINLDGIAYQLEEGGYNTLQAYLETGASRLERNPDREEILSDIERAIADKFRALLGSNKTVVTTKEVAAVIADLGPIEPGAATSADPAPPGAPPPITPMGASAPPPRRLYRIYEGAMVSGVCNGLAAYFNIDPTLVRLAFAFLTVFWGAGLLLYLIMAIVVPVARTAEEKSAASGPPPTAQEFVRRAKEGYYGAMKGFPDRAARREWRRRFKREMRAHSDGWRHNWQTYWSEQAPGSPGLGFALPMLSLLQGAATVLWICALISLLRTHAIFGLEVPSNMPMWVAALLLVFAYGLLAGPLKMARRACFWGMGRTHSAWFFIFLADALVWLTVVAACIWLAMHFFPQLREAFKTLPALAHQAKQDIHTWWTSR